MAAPLGESASGGSNASIQGNNLAGFAVGIDVESVKNGGDSVTASIGTTTANTIIGDAGSTGVVVSGKGASATLANTSFSGNAIDLNIATGAAVTDSGGNAFTGATYISDLASTVTLDASGDTFSGAALDTSNLSQAYAIENRINDVLDTPGEGYVSLSPTDVYVSAQSESTTPGAIQRGVDVVPNASLVGTTVHVQAGSFAGSVNIVNKANVTLDGAGQGATTIVAPSNIASQFSTGSGDKFATIYTSNSTTVIENLTVDGNDVGNNYADGFLGVAFYNAGGTVDHVAVTNIENNPFNGVQDGVAIYADNADSVAHTLNITNDTLTHYQKNGMALFGDGLTIDVSHNVVTGEGDTPLIGQNGIEVGFGATGTISNNTVSGNEYSGTNPAAPGGPDQFADTQSTGLLLFGTSNLTVTGNTVDGNDIGIYNNTDNAVISGNILGSTTANRYEGIVADQGSATISNNIITGGNLGIDVVTYDGEGGTAGEPSSAILDGNIVSGAGVGIEAISQTPGSDPAVKVLAQNNILIGNGEGVAVSGGATVDLGYDSSDTTAGHSAFSGLGTSSGNNTLTGYADVPGHYAIDDQNTSTQPNVLAEDNNFGPASANNPGAIGEVIHDSADSSSLSTVFYIPAHNIQPAPLTVYINADWANSAFGSNQNGTNGGTSIGYDEFSDLQAAINAVASGGTIFIANGTYDPSNILINIPVTISGASEPGVIITPSLTDSHDDSSFGGTVSNGFIIASSNVTIQNLTLDGGAHQDFRNAIITNSQRDGQTYSNININHVTAENIFRKGVAIYNETGTASGISITNDTFDNVGTIINDGGAYEATAAIAVFGSNANISNNVITHSAGGIEGNTFDGAAEQVTVSHNNISMPSTVLTKGALGIDLGSLAAGSTVSHNTIDLSNAPGGTSRVNIGIVISFDQGAVSVDNNTIIGKGADDGVLVYEDTVPVAITNNTISGSTGGAGIVVTAQASDTSRFSGDTAGPASATITGNTISGNAAGVEVVSDGAPGHSASASIGDGTANGSNTISGNGFGIIMSGDGASGSVVDNQISGDDASVGLEMKSLTSSPTIADNTIDGTDIGIYAFNDSAPITVSGGTIENVHDGVNAGNGVLLSNDNFIDPPSQVSETLTLDHVTLLNNDTAVQAIDDQGGSAGSVTIGLSNGTTISGGAGDVGLLVDGVGASVAGDTVNDTAFSGTGRAYIELRDGALGGNTLDSTRATYEGRLITKDDLPAAYAAEDKILDYLDDSSVGYVSLQSGNVFVAQSSETGTATEDGTPGAIQRGINVTPANGTLYAQAGTFVGDVTIDHAMTLDGAQAGNDPAVANPTAGNQTIIMPDQSDPNPNDATSVTVVYVSSSDVTIDGVTVDGSNTASSNFTHASGAPLNADGNPIDAAEGIVSYEGVGNITVQNNIVKNTAYTGIDFYNYNNRGAATTNNVIAHNEVLNLSDFYGYGVGILLYNNFYAQVNNNTITNVTVGVQTGNFYLANTGAASSISNNTISASALGIFYNLMYEASSTFTVADNQITAINSSADAPWAGILISSIQSATNADFENNTIDGSAAFSNATLPSAGYEVWNTPTTGSVTISGGSVTGVDYGVWVNSFEGYNSPAHATQATISGVNITANVYGVYVEDSAGNSSHPPVSATVDGNTTVSAPVGVFVSGANASADVHDATIVGAAGGPRLSRPSLVRRPLMATPASSSMTARRTSRTTISQTSPRASSSPTAARVPSPATISPAQRTTRPTF